MDRIIVNNDIGQYLYNDVDINKTILIIGCDLSKNFNNLKLYIEKFNNITISDNIDLEDQPINYHIDLPVNRINELPITKKYYDSLHPFAKKNVNKGISLCNHILKDLYEKIDIIKDDLTLLNYYDIIQLRYILHLSIFKDIDKIQIINKLYNKLNLNGKLLIQNYNKYDDEHYDFTDNEIKELKKEYGENIEIQIWTDDDGYYPNKRNLIITKT